MSSRARAFVLLALAALLVAAPAFANGKKHWKHRGHGHHHRHHHGCGHGGYWAPRYVEHHYARPYPVYHHGPAYCGPCGDYFDSYDDLSYHVHHHHRVAVIHLPFVLFEASIGGGIGWVFDH